MPDYTPPYAPGRIVTLTVSAAVTARDLLVVSGSGTVAKAAANASTSWVGVAGNDTPINGRCTVFGRGIIHESIADGTVTAGDQVGTTSTAGRQVKTVAVQDVGGAPSQATINAALVALRGVAGIALTTAADGLIVRWMEI